MAGYGSQVGRGDGGRAINLQAHGSHLARAAHLQDESVTGVVSSDAVGQGGVIVDRLATDRKDYVALGDASAGGRTAGPDIRNDNALRRLQAKALGHLVGESLAFGA